jgi:hypothetical protein
MQQTLRAALAALCLTTACGGAGPTADVEEGDQTLESGTPHALPFGLSADAAATPRAHLTDYGGPVLANAKVVAVLWGDGVDATVSGKIGGFYKAVVGSPYFTWLSEYDTASQKIGKGILAGTVAIAPHSARTTLSDAQIEKELAAQIKSGKLPAPDADTVFMIHFPPGVSITMGGSASCQSGGFCGYHSAFRRGGKRVAYAVLPDMSAGSGCDTGCGSGATPFDVVTSVASHELVEATTDPEVGLAKGLNAPLAWYDEKNGEIGDICNGKSGKLRAKSATYTVQKQWSNAAGACVLGRGKGGADEISADDN